MVDALLHSDDRDLVRGVVAAAVTFLSVQIPPRAARAILDTAAEALSVLLRAVGPDRDLVRRIGSARPGVACLGPGNGAVGVAGDRPDEGHEADCP